MTDKQVLALALLLVFLGSLYLWYKKRTHPEDFDLKEDRDSLARMSDPSTSEYKASSFRSGTFVLAVGLLLLCIDVTAQFPQKLMFQDGIRWRLLYCVMIIFGGFSNYSNRSTELKLEKLVSKN